MPRFRSTAIHLPIVTIVFKTPTTSRTTRGITRYPRLSMIRMLTLLSKTQPFYYSLLVTALLITSLSGRLNTVRQTTCCSKLTTVKSLFYRLANTLESKSRWRWLKLRCKNSKSRFNHRARSNKTFWNTRSKTLNLTLNISAQKRTTFMTRNSWVG